MFSLLETHSKLRLGAKSLLEDKALKDSFDCMVCKLHLKLLQTKRRYLWKHGLLKGLSTHFLGWGRIREEASLSPNSVTNYNSL